jgi:hypothetical protein
VDPTVALVAAGLPGAFDMDSLFTADALRRRAVSEHA